MNRHLGDAILRIVIWGTLFLELSFRNRHLGEAILRIVIWNRHFGNRRLEIVILGTPYWESS